LHYFLSDSIADYDRIGEQPLERCYAYALLKLRQIKQMEKAQEGAGWIEEEKVDLRDLPHVAAEPITVRK